MALNPILIKRCYRGVLPPPDRLDHLRICATGMLLPLLTIHAGLHAGKWGLV